MKTIRTIIATLATVLLGFALVAWFSVRRNAAFIQRTIYQGFDQTFVVALVMGCAFLLIAIILTVAIVSTDGDDEEDEEEESYRPRYQTRPPAPRGEQPYRRVSRSVEQSRSRREEESYSRSERPLRRREEEPKPTRRRTEEAPRRRERMAERPDDVALERREVPVKKKAPKPPVPAEEEPERENLDTLGATEAEAPQPLAPAAEVEGAAPEVASEEDAPAEASDPEKEETVRCIFCGGEMPRSAEVCPHCGKKR